jgi:23S rRNA (adenine2503-C2)-methyltransferase
MNEPVAIGVKPHRLPSRYDLDRAALDDLLADLPRYRVDQIWAGLHQQLAGPLEITNLPKQLRTELDARPEFRSALAVVAESTGDHGDTVKWAFQLEGGHRIETVLMHYADRSTVCISTQAGCAMACGFCATGQGGFVRHLSTGEIVEQVVVARRSAEATGRRLSNVVFMGMGEPLANYGPVWDAVVRIHDHLGLSARHLTISTVGIVPGIRRLAQESLPVNLAVSLHAANDVLRNELVPINKTYPLADLYDACADYLYAKGRRLSFEWAMIADTNDRVSDAKELADFARPLGAHVNLIPLNPTPGYPAIGSSAERVRDFRDALAQRRVNVTVRRNRGTSIDAACGQLAARVHEG